MQSKNSKIIFIVAVLIFAVAAVITLMPRGEEEVATTDRAKTTKATIGDNGDLVIPVANISDKATFYEYNELDSKMEIIALKASDGSVRTAFNTCQVCYSSGRGYYKQEGNNLICQNCGNRFGMNEVGVTRGGCNPVPITDTERTVTDENIIVTKELLEQAEIIFINWKS